MIISVADQDHLIKMLQIKDLPYNWRRFTAYSELQNIGSEWYGSKESLLLKVPSAIIAEEYNYLINTEHPDFIANVKLVRTENYFWDDRLL
jgi:RES domain-containing protein